MYHCYLCKPSSPLNDTATFSVHLTLYHRISVTRAEEYIREINKGITERQPLGVYSVLARRGQR